MEFAIPPLKHLMAMDLLQLAVLGLNLANTVCVLAICEWPVTDILALALPSFDCLSFCLFHFDGFHFSSRRVGIDKHYVCMQWGNMYFHSAK